jgi:hypothetical protein
VHLEDGDIEGSAAEIVDGNDLSFAVLVESVRERRSRWFVDYPENVKTSDLPSILGRLPLRVVEVGRDGDDSMAFIC